MIGPMNAKVLQTWVDTIPTNKIEQIEKSLVPYFSRILPKLFSIDR